MLASEARAIGARWLDERLLPSTAQGGVRGAFVMGSLAALADGDEFDAVASDIDLAIVVDPKVVSIDSARYPHGRSVFYAGCLVQANFVPQEVLESDERLFGMLGLGCNLRHGRIISDPDGAIAAARSKIVQDWAKPRWRTHRTERAITFARSALEGLDEEEKGAEGLARICDLVMQLAGLVAIAHGVTPTHRRALALAHSLLDPLGQSDLLDRMLGAIGADDADDAFVSACTDDAIAALRVAVRYDDPTMEWSGEPPDALAAVVAAGIDQLVAEGYVREAVLPALGCLAECSMSVGDRASVPDRAELDRLVERRLRDRPTAFSATPEQRAALRSLFDDTAQLCRTIARA